VILMANKTATGKEFGIPQVSLEVFNFMSWGLLLYFVNDFFGFGKNKKNLTRNR
jgi:hypothetical protein